ncbi:hypothetical protein BHE74_00011621 [Ensete ventricosum]|nr:hypothetical protein BHE74_00011621 [Ensete ventricosum]
MPVDGTSVSTDPFRDSRGKRRPLRANRGWPLPLLAALAAFGHPCRGPAVVGHPCRGPGHGHRPFSLLPSLRKHNKASPVGKGGAYGHCAHRSYRLRELVPVRPLRVATRGQNGRQRRAAPPLRRGDGGDDH